MRRKHQSNPVLIEFGLRLRKLRHDKGWTLEEVEEHGDISWRHLQQIETGNKNVNLTTLVKLGRLYGVKPFELLKGL